MLNKISIFCYRKRSRGESNRSNDAWMLQDLQRRLLIACGAGDDQAVRNLVGAKADVNDRRAVLRYL